MNLPDINSHDSTEASSEFQPDSLAAGISIMLLLTVGQRCVGFARQVLVCRYLEPDDLGRWNLAFSMMMLLAPLFVLGLPGTFNRYAEFYRHRGQVRSFFRKTLMATVALTILGSVAMLLAAKPSAWLIFSDTTQVPLVLMLVPTLVSVIAFNSLVEMMSSLRQVRLVAYMRFGHALLFSLLALAMVIHFQGTTEALIASYALASLLTCAAVTFPVLRIWRSVADQPRAASLPLWSKLLPFAGWIWLADLMSNLFAAADRYMMIHLMHGDPDQAAALIGQYHSSRIIPQLFVAVAILLGAAILPYLSNDWEDGRRQARIASAPNCPERLCTGGNLRWPAGGLDQSVAVRPGHGRQVRRGTNGPAHDAVVLHSFWTVLHRARLFVLFGKGWSHQSGAGSRPVDQRPAQLPVGSCLGTDRGSSRDGRRQCRITAGNLLALQTARNAVERRYVGGDVASIVLFLASGFRIACRVNRGIPGHQVPPAV